MLAPKTFGQGDFVILKGGYPVLCVCTLRERKVIIIGLSGESDFLLFLTVNKDVPIERVNIECNRAIELGEALWVFRTGRKI